MNIKKRILSFLLAIVMILTMVPALAVSAEEPVAVDLIHSSGTTLREGVYLTSFGGEYIANTYYVGKVINNINSDTWASAWSPSDYAWVQINLPAASQWTNVTIMGTSANDYKVAFKVLASNDPTFTTSTVLAEKAGSYGNDRELVIDDAAKLATPYRYLRVIGTGSKRFGVSEIDITGYLPTLPTTDGLADLTQKTDVYAKASTENADAYKAQQVIDGNAETAYTVTGGTNPELMIDLMRESAIKMIEFTPVTGNDAYRKNYEISTSNDPEFADCLVVYKRHKEATADGDVVRAYMPDNKSARYVRIKSDGTDLGVVDLKVWGTEGSAFTLENMVSPSSVTATSGENAEYTVDGDAATVWKNAEEATKSAIVYDLEAAMTAQSKDLLATTSIMLLPGDSEESRANFKIYGSLSGDFTTDAELIKEVGETPLALGQYEIVLLEVPKAYKKIKIEKSTEPCSAESLAFREVRIIHNSQDAAVKVQSTAPANGVTGITNFGTNPASLTNLIEIELNRNIVASSINPTNVIIKDITDGADTVLNNWTAYEVSDKKAYIDIANLQSNKTYEVTLTTNVLTVAGALENEYKFTFSTGNIISVPYNPNKVLVNIVTDKQITGNRNTSYGPLTNAIDGNNSTYMLSSGAPKMQIDLGNFYDIVAVELVPDSNASNKVLLRSLNILGSETSIDYSASGAELSEMTLATYPADSDKTETLIFENSANVRYLGLYRASTYMVLSEFRAYAYVDKDTVDFGAWMVNDSTTTEEFAAAGDYNFSLVVNNSSSESTSLYMTVFAYDNNGQLVTKSNATKTVASGKQTISSGITLNAEEFAKATKITAVLTKAQGDARMVVDAKTITKTGADLTGPETLTPDSTKVEYTALTDGERVAVQVLGPNSTGLGYDFDEIGEVAFNTELCYASGTGMLAKDEKATFYFKADSEDLGEYRIRMTVTKKNGTKATYDSYLLYLSQANIDECIAEFKAFPQTLTMRQLLDKWTDNLSTGKKYIRMTELPTALSTTVPARFDAMFEYLCDLYEASGKMTTVADVVDCLNAAYVMSMYEAGDVNAVKAALTKYEGDICGLYARKDPVTKEEIIDVARYSGIYTSLKGNITDAATMKSVMEWTVPLSLIQNGTREDITDALTIYPTVLAYDLSYATSKNVTIAQVAMKISNTNASAYYNAFATVFETAVDAVVAGNGGGGTGGVKPPSPIVTPGVGPIGSRPSADDKDDEETPVLPEDKPAEEPEKIAFGDIEGIDWAKDHINALYEKGIISGDGDGNFYPNRQVKREEFLKMLIEALEIDATAKETSEFEDCEKDAWYYPYVLIASTNKITKGVTRKTFGIGQDITRQDMAVLLSKALAVKNVIAMESDYVFDDVDAISEYAQSDVSKMYELGIISGMGDGTFAPNAYTTRAQAAVIISRALEILGGASK